MSSLDASVKQVLSPKWKKPGDVMKKIYQRKKKTSTRSLAFSQSDLDSINTSKSIVQKKYRNPFVKKRSNSTTSEQDKKRILSLNDENLSNFSIQEDIERSYIFDAGNDENDSSALDFVYLSEDSFMGLVTMNTDSTKDALSFRKSLLPVDWTLKSKARFLSSSTFSWCARIKGSEEASAISRATRCLKDNELSANFRVQLGQSLVYWQHPYIPWFNLFPRYGSDCSLLSLTNDEPNLPEKAQSSLYDSWVVAFRSAYQLLRNNLCPFFYVCSQQYTALFRSSEITASEIDCVLSPTSLGFRKALTSDGITFSMPLQKPVPKSEFHQEAPPISVNCSFPASITENRLDSKDVRDCNTIEEDEDLSQEDVDSEDEQNWKNISENLSFKKSKSMITAATEDGLPSTAILIEGMANTQLLFNHLLNSRNSIATSGRQIGMPPTILSPVSFNNATLRKLDCRAGIAKVKSAFHNPPTSGKMKQPKQHYSVDISGPIMPHHINGIVTLLKTSQENGDYSCSFGTYLYTGSFNAPCGSTKKCTNTTEKDATTGNDFLRDFVKNFDFRSPPVTMRKMSALNGSYDWEV